MKIISEGDSTVPKVSVVIQSYNRPRLMFEAAKSVLDQETEHTVEVIVVKNYHDQELDVFLDSNGMRNIYNEDKTLIGKFKVGFSLVRGEILVLMDDDDLFLPEKIEKVVTEFHDNPRLIYYHNFFDEIDESGNMRKSVLMKPAGTDVVIHTYNMKENRRKELFFDYAYYNSSCIAMRRREFLEAFKKFPELHSRPVDMNFFFICCSTGMEVKLSRSVLTHYRVKKGSTTFGRERNEQKIDRMLKEIEVLNSMEKKSRGIFIFPMVQAHRIQVDFSLFLIQNSHRRPSVKSLILYIYYSYKRRNRFVMMLTVLLYFGLISRKRYANITSGRLLRRLEFVGGN